MAESPYLKQVGIDLHPNIDILWTGLCVLILKYSTVVPN